MLAPHQLLDTNWGYALFLEGRPPAGLNQILEMALRENPHYALARDLRQLAPLVIIEISGDGYETYVRAQLAAGFKLGEIKPVSLSTTTHWKESFAPPPVSGVIDQGRPSRAGAG